MFTINPTTKYFTLLKWIVIVLAIGFVTLASVKYIEDFLSIFGYETKATLKNDKKELQNKVHELDGKVQELNLKLDLLEESNKITDEVTKDNVTKQQQKQTKYNKIKRDRQNKTNTTSDDNINLIWDVYCLTETTEKECEVTK